MSMHQALVGTLIVKGLSERDAVWIADKYLLPLERDSVKLTYLELAGVDNWEGYGNAMAKYYEDHEDYDD